MNGNCRPGPGRGTYLFDLSSDLAEAHNLAQANPTRVAKMLARLYTVGAGGPSSCSSP